MNSYLVVSKEDFNRGYNLNITNLIENLYGGADYLSWAVVAKLLKQEFPTLTAEISRRDYTYNKDGDVNGVILYAYLIDLVTGLKTPEMSFPVMDNRNNSIAYPDARDINDNEQRAKVKAIAIYTGIGLRLWSREEIDRSSHKNSNKDHPKFQMLLKLSRLIEEVEATSELPEGFIVPHFGMSLKELKAIAFNLESLLGIQNSTTELLPYQQWKKPADMIEWGKSQLNYNDADIKVLVETTQPDESGSKKIPFYNAVMDILKQTA